MGGTLEYLSGLLGGSGGHGHDKMTRRKQLQTVELKVRMDCEGCELKVRSALSSMKGSLSVSLGLLLICFLPCVCVLQKFQSQIFVFMGH
ncbi:hypothetical protein SEVIR_1G373501v4 [Setaria viridis]